MSKERVLAHIAELTREIDALEECDEETKAELAGLASEMRESIEAEDDDSDWSDVAGRIKEQVDQFEVAHPVLTGMLDKILTTLNNMGI